MFCQGLGGPKQSRQQAENPRAHHLWLAGPKRWGQKKEESAPNCLQLSPRKHCPFVEGGGVSKTLMLRLNPNSIIPELAGKRGVNMVRVYLHATFSLPQTNSALLLKSGNSCRSKTPFVMNLQSLKMLPNSID